MNVNIWLISHQSGQKVWVSADGQIVCIENGSAAIRMSRDTAQALVGAMINALNQPIKSYEADNDNDAA